MLLPEKAKFNKSMLINKNATVFIINLREEKSLKVKGKAKSIVIIMIILLQMIIIICSMGKKVNFHVDEYWTYTLSNSDTGQFDIEEGVTYSGDDIFLDSLAVNTDHRFDYSLVWENQKNDVHPPLYYVFMHTICSFFPGIFTRWFGLAVNLLFFVLSAILMYKLSYKLLGNFVQTSVALILWGCVVGTVNTAIYIRMYMMVSFWILGIAWLHSKVYEQKSLNWKFFLSLFCLSVGGALTHYYFLIFLFFTALFYGIFMLCRKRFKDVGLYILTYLISAICSLMIFPAMIDQIFCGYRGEEAFTAFTNIKGYFSQLAEYLKIVTNEISGNIWIFYVLVIFAIMVIVSHIKNENIKTVIDKLFKSPLFAFVLIGVCYYCVIAKIAPYITNRYISPIYSLITIVITAIIFKTKDLLISDKIVQYLFVGAFSLLIICATWTYGLQNIYSESQVAIDSAISKSNKNVLYVYDGLTWKLPCNRKELINYNSFTFITSDKLTAYLEGKNLNDMVFYITDDLDKENIINQIKKIDEDANVTFLYQSFYATAYML